MSAPDAPAPPVDHSADVAQMQIQAQKDKDAQDKIDAQKHVSDLAALRDSALGGARGNVDKFFSNVGLDPTAYGSDIDSQLQSILSSIAPTDENPGTAFQGAGQNVYNDLTKQYQTREQSALDKIFTPDYASKRINSTLDDPYVNDLVNEQRGSADQIIQNMLKRGVLTTTGSNAASADLDRQAAGVRTKVKGFGDELISGGQQKLNDVINQGRSTAGTLKLGQSFDPNTYAQDTDRVYNDFVSSLGDQIRAKAPGNLFQTNGLAAIGGAAQGAGNTAYNPAAAAGVIDPNADDTTTKPKTNPNSIF